MSDEKVVVELKYPIPKFDKEGNECEEKITSLTFGRLKAKHFKLFTAEKIEKLTNKQVDPYDMIPIIAALTNIDIKSADEIDAEDLPNLSDKLEDHMGKYQETGES